LPRATDAQIRDPIELLSMSGGVQEVKIAQIGGFFCTHLTHSEDLPPASTLRRM
jgi:hypothetical protein